MIGKWVISGATEHSKYRHGWFIELHPKTIEKFTQHTQMQNKGIFRNKQFRDKNRICQIHQNLE